MSIANLSGSAISNTYQRVVQTDGIYLADGTGSILNNLVITASHATTASYAYSASYEIIKEESSSFADTASYVNPLTQSVSISGSLTNIGSFNSSGGNTLLTIGSGTNFQLAGAVGGTLTYSYAEYQSAYYYAGFVGSGNVGMRGIGAGNRVLFGNDDTGTGLVLYGNNTGLGLVTPTAKLHVKGSGTTSATTALLVQNSDNNFNFSIKDNGDLTSNNNFITINSYDTTITGANKVTVNGTNFNTGYIYRNATNSFLTLANDGTVSARITLYGSTHATLPNLISIKGDTQITGSTSIIGETSIYKSGSTVLNIQGSTGQLFSITDSLTGSLFSVNTVAGLPVIEAFSDNTVNIGKFGTYPIKVVATGTLASITGSMTGSFTGSVLGSATSASYSATSSFINPLTQSVIISGSIFISGSDNIIRPSAFIGGVSDNAVITEDTIFGRGFMGIGTTIAPGASGNRNLRIITPTDGGGGTISIGYWKFGVGAFWNRALSISNSPAVPHLMLQADVGNTVIGTTTDIGAILGIRGSGTTSATTALRVENSSTTARLTILDDGTSAFNTSQLFISSSGNTGVSTSSPRVRLQVGDKVIDDNGYTYDSSSAMIIHPTQTSATVLNDPKEVLVLARQGLAGQAFGAAAALEISRYENSGTNSRTRLDFRLAHDSFIGSSNRVMTMLSSGNVGIGTTAPNAKLDVNGNAIITGSVTINSVLTLTPQNPLPTSGVPTGSFAVSSSTPPKPYFWDGTSWNALY